MLHILTLLHLVLCSVAGVKRLPVHHYSADYIFSGLLESLGQIEKTSSAEVGARGRGQ